MSSAVDLYWLPLGAGGWFVRRNGRLYERWAARREGRAPQPLYHSALEVTLDGRRHVVEMTPARRGAHGAVVRGPVGSRRPGRPRYEIRCWAGGTIPDVAEAVGGPLRLSDDPAVALRVLELVPQVPSLTWGRDESGTGDMWNSNSIVAWLLARAGVDPGALVPPGGGRAPGWSAGIAVANRSALRRPAAA